MVANDTTTACAICVVLIQYLRLAVIASQKPLNIHSMVLEKNAHT
ncbi:MAG: hypothetical protein WCR66_12315 [Bacteroidota bacterium]